MALLDLDGGRPRASDHPGLNVGISYSDWRQMLQERRLSLHTWTPFF